jgi:hypothetical protein
MSYGRLKTTANFYFCRRGNASGRGVPETELKK